MRRVPFSQTYLWKNGHVKTTVEIPDRLFRDAKATAARRGISLKELFAEALRLHLRRGKEPAASRPWMKVFGGLRDLHTETKRINRVIEEEFEHIEEEQWH